MEWTLYLECLFQVIFAVPKNVCKMIEIWFIQLTRSFMLWRVQVFSIKSRARNTPELKIRRKIARTLEPTNFDFWQDEVDRSKDPLRFFFQDYKWDLFITITIVIISGRCFLPIVVIIIVIMPEEV